MGREDRDPVSHLQLNVLEIIGMVLRMGLGVGGGEEMHAELNRALEAGAVEDDPGHQLLDNSPWSAKTTSPFPPFAHIQTQEMEESI